MCELRIDMETIDYLEAITDRLKVIIFLYDILSEIEEIQVTSGDYDLEKISREARYFLFKSLEKIHIEYKKTITSITKSNRENDTDDLVT